MKKLNKFLSMILAVCMIMALAACSSAAVPAPAAPAQEATPAEETPAEPEQLEVTVYFGSPEDEMMPVLNAFAAKYPNVTLKTYRAPTEELMATMQMELAANNPQFDVVIVANTSIKTLEKDYDAFAPFVPEEIDAIPEGLRDPNNIEIPVGQNFYVIEYNTNLVTEEEAPKSWTDLLDSKWDNKIAIADPASSSSIYGLIWFIEKQKGTAPYGEGYFEELQKNNPLYIASHGTIDQMVSMGERSIGVQMVLTATNSVEQGNPVSWVFPEDGIPSEVNVASIVKGTKNQKAAELLVNYLLSEEGQTVIGQNLYIPARTDADYTFNNGQKFTDITVYGRDVDWISENKESIISFFQDLTA